MEARSSHTQVRLFDDPEEMARGVADRLLRWTASRLEAGERFTVALSGGTTPLHLFDLLSQEPYRGRIPWHRIHFFWGDERMVPPDHEESNYGTADRALLRRLQLPSDQIHRIRGEVADPDEAAAEYASELRTTFRLREGELPRFDLVLLGMGTDGHIASLFPGNPALWENRKLVTSAYLPKPGIHRITLTCPVINNAACIVFMVAGEEKAEILRRALEGPHEPHLLPAQLVRPQEGEFLWYIDRAAGRLLSQSTLDSGRS